MDLAIRREDLFAVDREIAACKVRHSSAGFLQDHQAGGGVPGVQIHFPKAIDAAERRVAEIQRGGAAAPDGLALDHEGLELTHCSFDFFAEAVRKSRHDQSAAKRIDIRHMEPLSVHKTAEPSSPAEHLIA